MYESTRGSCQRRVNVGRATKGGLLAGAILLSVFFPAFVSVVCSLVEIAADDVAGFPCFKRDFVSGLTDLAGGSVCFAMPFLFGLARSTGGE